MSASAEDSGGTGAGGGPGADGGPGAEGGPEPRDRAEAGGLEIRIDRDTCMGSGNCLFWAPGSFDLADDGRATVLDPAATDEDRLRVTAEGCPVGAISLWRDGVQVC